MQKNRKSVWSVQCSFSMVARYTHCPTFLPPTPPPYPSWSLVAFAYQWYCFPPYQLQPTFQGPFYTECPFSNHPSYYFLGKYILKKRQCQRLYKTLSDKARTTYQLLPRLWDLDWNIPLHVARYSPQWDNLFISKQSQFFFYVTMTFCCRKD